MKNRFLVAVLSIMLLLSFSGCGSNTEDKPETVSETIAEKQTEDNSESKGEKSETVLDATENNQEVTEDENEGLNSFSMMYYLAITAEEIRTSKNNRLILDDIYTSLLNDINPSAIDETTQDHLKNLRDIINSYIGISIKRERLQYIYNQNKAEAIRSAVPNPIAILSTANSLDWKRLAISVVYTAVDSYNGYKSASESADREFLMSGWELDDEELATVQRNRNQAFDYMVDMVQKYHLDGMRTLSEKAIEKFAEICAIKSTPEKISRLKAEKETYELLGNYWLELADCYFETGRYEDCLECVNRYSKLSSNIYRKDYNLVQILPKAIVAAQNTYSGEQYVSSTGKFADLIVKNTSTEDWSTRYFVAQVYLDLYTKTNDRNYLQSAYKIALENVTVLLKGQRSLNETYLADVKEVKVDEPDYKYLSEEEKEKTKKEFKEEQKRAKKYNKEMKKERVTELPPLYEPLILNCELLFSLAEKLDISASEKEEIDAILGEGSESVFLSKPIMDAYSFSEPIKDYNIDFDKKEICIPADELTKNSLVTAIIKEKGNEQNIEDFILKKVVRKDSSVDTFSAFYSSKQLKKYEWTADSKVIIKIKYRDAYDKAIYFKYKVKELKKHWYGDKVVFVKE